MKTPLASIAWVAVGTVLGSFGAVFLKIGAERLSRNLKSLLSNWRLALGVGLYLLSSVFYVMGVRNGELSVLYPMASLASVWTLLWSKLLLQELITRPKIVAVGMILAGCVLLGLGSRFAEVHEQNRSLTHVAQAEPRP